MTDKVRNYFISAFFFFAFIFAIFAGIVEWPIAENNLLWICLYLLIAFVAVSGIYFGIYHFRKAKGDNYSD